MRTTKEIKALLQLIDDPDAEVYDTISEKLLYYGKSIIPNLESLWEQTTDESVQERIETLIHRVHFQDLQAAFLEWGRAKRPELMQGALLIAKYQYPDLEVPPLLKKFDRIRKNIWLELNNYLTPLEQINVLNSILFNYYKFHGHELTEREPKHFFINHLLEGKQGNSYSLSILYLSLCELLDIPVFAMNIPRQFVLAYIDTLFHFFSSDAAGVEQIQFFIEPLSGMIYTQTDVSAYLKKINADESPLYYTPLSNKQIIIKMLEELSLCYHYQKDDMRADEMQQLIQILTEDNNEA